LTQATEFQALIDPVPAPVPASLTVVCEGRASQTRDEWGVEYDVTPYGHSAIAARLQMTQAHGGVARQWFAPPAGALEGDPAPQPAGEILAFLPLDAPTAGNSAALVWSVQDGHADALMAMSDADFCLALQDACNGAVGQTVGALQLSAPRQRWPLHLARAKQWVGVTQGQTWALAGDAAHSVHPLSGQGLNLGLADAVELACVLGAREAWRHVADLKPLRAYERARKLDAALLAGATDGLQRLFAQNHPAALQLRNRGMGWFDAAWSLKSWVARRAMGFKP
jgi:2-polyprenyl-6-methoxyphenol hydroxylase-like FAD-dependent oxidoreductase